MPREFLPKRRKREPREKAQFFPRTAARVLAGPARDRMMRRCDTVDRGQVKTALRRLGLESPAVAIQHIED